MKQIVIFFLFLIYDITLSADMRIDPLVLTNQGLVKGTKSENSDYSYFLGIPYAKVDPENPFGASTTYPEFDEVFDAVDGSLKCPQLSDSNPILNTNQDVDCLTLNIYAPSKASSRNPLPVMVYIHGGGFTTGYSEEYGIPNLVHQNIIVVTLNYRLGVYGFLCLNSSLAPGNQGLKDQYEALQWVQRNINAFGGNPNNVTLAGLNAGSVSVMLHLFSPRDKLFNKVIAQSGVPLSDSLFFEGDPDGATKLAEHLGFVTSNTEEALKFLSTTSHELITSAAKEINLITLPCRENTFEGVEKFVDKDPFTMENLKNFKNTPILIGNTEFEAYGKSLFYHAFVPENVDPFYYKLMKNFILDDDQMNTAEQIIRNFYIGDESVSSSDVEISLSDFVSDIAFNYAIHKTITNLVNGGTGSIYQYVFSYSETGIALHASDVKYLFNNNWDNDDQKLISERFSNLFGNFVKSGNPTPQATDLVPLTWTPVSTEKRPYMVIDTDIRMENRFLKERMAFWDLFYVAFEKYNKYSAYEQ